MMHINTSARIAIGILIIGALGFAANYYFSYQRSLTPVTFHYNHVEGASVALYKGSRKDITQADYDAKSKPIAVPDGATLELQDWPYVVVVSGDGIETTKRLVYPLQIPQTVTLSVSKTPTDLAALLRQEDAAIRNTLLASNSRIATLYELHDIKLHGDGTWATVGLRYTGPDVRQVRDPLHAVLQKHSDSWHVISEPRITTARVGELKSAPESVFWSTLPERVLPSQGDTSH